MKVLLILILAIFLVPELEGQSSNSDPTGRLNQIEEQRLEKAQQTRPDESDGLPKPFIEVGDFVRRAHLSAGIEGLGPGHGITIGSFWAWNGAGDHLLYKLWGTGTFPTYYTVGTGVELRRFSRHDVILSLDGTHSDAPQLPYYGEGPNSSIHNQTDYRREDTFFNFRAGFHEKRRLRQACQAGKLLLNIGPGTDGSLPSTESVFGPAEAPGIQTQSNFFIGGCSAQIDSRDPAVDPHKGSFAEAAFRRYEAQKTDQFSFSRLSIAGEQYFPFLNRKRVVVIRGRTELSYHSADQVVPFYLQPTLGSDTELRGYRRYRFYDENSLALTAEYRWEINAAFDMEVFADSGQVFHQPGQISLSEMKTSAGFGFRLSNRRNIAGRLDIGFSHEGVQVWLKVGKLL